MGLALFAHTERPSRFDRIVSSWLDGLANESGSLRARREPATLRVTAGTNEEDNGRVAARYSSR